MNKFRIVEQRGVFRIQSHRSYRRNISTTEKRRGWFRDSVWTENYETIDEWYFCAKRGGVEFYPNDIRYKNQSAKWDLRDFGPGTSPVYANLGSVPASMRVKEYEFDTYKKAENYIKKFYGSTGVDAIEKPEWRTA